MPLLRLDQHLSQDVPVLRIAFHVESVVPGHAEIDWPQARVATSPDEKVAFGRSNAALRPADMPGSFCGNAMSIRLPDNLERLPIQAGSRGQQRSPLACIGNESAT